MPWTTSTASSAADRPQLAAYVCLTEYDATFGLPDRLSARRSLTNILGDVLANAGKSQLRIAETEKYAHVTFFFNGGVEEPFPGEDRCLIPSPKEVATYDQKPEMSAYQVTDELLKQLDAGQVRRDHPQLRQLRHGRPYRHHRGGRSRRSRRWTPASAG